MRQPLRFALLLALLFPVAMLSSCQRPPPEQRLREAIDGLQQSIENRDAAAIEDWLADDFIGPDGLDRPGARRLAQLMYMRHRDVGVTMGPVQVELRPEHATVEFTAALTGGSGGLLPEAGRIYDVRTGWRLDDNEWRLTSAQWTPATR